jgi:predicted O-linked N-acetylglucosamine transferase (SPINDLY family)
LSKKRQQQLRELKKRREVKTKKAGIVRMPSDPTKEVPEINYAAFMRAVGEGDLKAYDAVIEYLLFFERHHYLQFGVQALKSIANFVTLSSALLLREDMTPSKQQSIALVQLGHLYNHLASMTGYSNDRTVQMLMLQQHNLPKVLFALNSRGEFQIDQSKLFDLDPTLASMWFNSYILGISSPTKRMQQNLYRHFAKMDERWQPLNHQVTGTYFTCTYMAPEYARRCKGIMNRAMKKTKTWEFKNTPRQGKRPHIAIVTNKWHRNHAVYKSAGPLVEQLRGFADLSLIWTGDRLPESAVTDYFSSVMHCYFKQNGDLVIPESMADNDFNMVYFTDIGMSNESVWLSNCRIAPVQAMGYGHPDTSGDDSEIDYFIGGDVEKESTDSYSETMVMLPGLGQHPAWPTAERMHNHNNDDVVRINCVWGPDKYNYTLLSVLAEINNEVMRRTNKAPEHEFHLFGSPGLNRYAALPNFMQEVKGMLPNAQVHAEWEYYDYMREAEKNDFSLNSFQFGCYNVLVESLWMGLPFLTIYGNRFYNKAGKWLNEKVGMPENNFESPRGMINRAADLILQPELLAEQRAKLASVDLKDALFDTNDHFLQAVQYILQNHPFTETKLIGE